MALRGDAQGFLVGDPASIEEVGKDIASIKDHLGDIRLMLVAGRRDAAKAVATASAPMVVSPKPNKRGASGQNAIAATVARRVAQPVMAGRSVRSGKPERVQAIVEPVRRDIRGRYVADGSAGRNDPTPEQQRTGFMRGLADGIAGRVKSATVEATQGMSDADPTLKAMQEVAGPMKGAATLLGLGGDKEDRWNRRLFRFLTSWRKEENTADKKAEKRLKAIEEKPTGEEGKGGIFGLIVSALSMIAGLAPAVTAAIAGLGTTILAGLGALVARIPVVGPALARGLSALTRGLGLGAAGAAAKPGLWQRTKQLFGRGAAGGAGTADGASAGGGGARAGRLAKFGRLAGGAARRIPILGSLIGLGLGAFSSSAIASDTTTTRQQKNEAQGKNWGGITGGIIGAALGTALGPVGTIVGAVVGDWLGSKVGGLIGSSWSQISVYALATFDTMRDGWNWIADKAGIAFDAVKAGWDGLIEKAGAVYESVKSAYVEKWTQFVGMATAVFDGVKGAIDSIISALQRLPVIGPAITKVIELHKAAADAIKNRVQQTVDGGAQLAKDVGNAAVDRARQTLAGGAQLAKDAASAVGSGLSNVANATGYSDHLAARRAEASALDTAERRRVAAASTGSHSISEVLESGRGYNVVRQADGSVVRNDGARNWRNNNPGNIEYGDFAKKMGAIGSDGRFAIFPDYSSGRKAKESLIFGGENYRDKSLTEAIARYAPPSENNTAAYQSAVLASVGGANKRMRDYTPEERQRIMDAMQKVEGFRAGKVQVIQPGNAATAIAASMTPEPDFSSVTGGVVAPLSKPTAPVQVATATLPQPQVPSFTANPQPVVRPVVKMPKLPPPPNTDGLNAALAEPQIPMPLNTQDRGRPPIKVNLPWQDIGQDLRERGIAHIVTGGLSAAG